LIEIKKWPVALNYPRWRGLDGRSVKRMERKGRRRKRPSSMNSEVFRRLDIWHLCRLLSDYD
jgi:hypothetical protein